MTNLINLLADATSFVDASSTSFVSTSDRSEAVDAIVRAHADDNLIDLSRDLAYDIMVDSYERSEQDREYDYNAGDWMDDDSRY